MGQLLHPRVLAILAIVAGALFVNMNFVPHHADQANPFNALFMHLVPERLVVDPHAAHGDAHGDAAGHADDGHATTATGEHADPGYLLALPLWGPLAIFDMTPEAARHGAGHGAAHDAQLILTNYQVFQLAAVLLIFVCLSGVPRYLRTGRGDVVTRFFAGFAHWVRNEVVYPVMGETTGMKFLPWFLGVFFFILFMNVMGLIPFSATATSTFWVTGALAATTLALMIFGGMVVQGPVAFWKNLVPHVPWWLWPLLLLVELIGLIVKPVALMIRLFATQMGGHLVVLSFIGLIFAFAGEQLAAAASYGTAPLWVAFAVFIMIIEIFVALLQAYIFTQLSVIFVQASIHPEH